MQGHQSIVHNQNGQGLIEYVILVALVGVATIGMVRLLQKSVNVNLARVVNSLQGTDAAQPAHEAVSGEDLKKKDFKDFMNGTRSEK